MLLNRNRKLLINLAPISRVKSENQVGSSGIYHANQSARRFFLFRLATSRRTLILSRVFSFIPVSLVMNVANGPKALGQALG